MYRAAVKTFSNIKTSAYGSSKTPISAVRTSVLPALRPALARVNTPTGRRYVSHFGLVLAVGTVIAGNTPAFTQALAYRTVAARGTGTLDAGQTAMVAADVANRSSLLVADVATETALKLKKQPVLPKAKAGAPVQTPVAASTESKQQVSEYVVQKNDTVSTVASLYNVSPATVNWANNLSDADALQPGQKLVILPVTGVLHVIKDGDSPEKIAQVYNANAEEIVRYNKLEDGKLPAVGEKLIVPNGEKPEPKPVTAVAAAPATGAPKAAPAPAAPKPAAPARYSGRANSYAYGYCTYYAASRRAIPGNWGDARSWLYNAQASGYMTGSAPVPGAIAWTSAGYYGHVAIVESVSGGMVTVSEMNYNGNWNRVTSRTVPASSFRYIY